MTQHVLDEQAQPPLRSITSSDGTTIVYDQIGSGPPVVLVCGGLNQRVMYQKLVDLLCDKFTVINYDRRGRGDSADGDPTKYSMDLELEDFTAILAEADQPPFVVANCTGAILAAYAAARGVPMAKIAMYEPPYGVGENRPIAQPDYLNRLQSLVDAGRNDEAVMLFQKEAVGNTDDFIERFRTHPAWPLFAGLAHTLPYEHVILGDGVVPEEIMKRVPVPTLVMEGSLSPDWQRNACGVVSDLIPGAKRMVIQGAGHVMPLAEIADPVTEFFLS
jgi:pimeloyl-ACP methyl ester carboxylesterase